MIEFVGLTVITGMWLVLLWVWGWLGLEGGFRQKIGPFCFMFIPTALILGILWTDWANWLT